MSAHAREAATMVQGRSYPGLQQLPDGRIVANTDTTWRENDGGGSIVSVRFTLSELDALAPR